MKKEEIRKARISLRKIHKKYVDELYDIVSKIDKSLETMDPNA